MKSARQIVTTYDPKPIPLRQFDWVATFDDYDGAPIDENTASGCPIGYGATEAEAIADLTDSRGLPNATLLDAAPMLYAALAMVEIELGPLLNDDPHSRMVRDRIRAALAKAEGQP